MRYTYTPTGRRSSARVIGSNLPVAPSDVGAASMPDYATLRAEAIKQAGIGRRTFAGQSDDPFFVDLRVFDLLYGGNSGGKASPSSVTTR